MTRIITIAGDGTGVGKTHLAVNLSLELVRRGRQVGLFHIPGGDSPIERFIDIQPLIERRQQAGIGPDHLPVIRRGYLGVDVLSCEIPLAEWSTMPADTLMPCANSMDISNGYEQFLVDTSGMGPRELASCCLASPVIMLVVTPAPQSQAEAFALLRILQLNGYDGEVRLLVNRVPSEVDALDIYHAFTEEVTRHLDLRVDVPWVILEDDCIPRSERYRQAFSAVFPDSDAAAGIVVVADDIDNGPEWVTVHTLPDWWGRFIEIMRTPIHLPGNALLETPASAGTDAGG